MFSTTPITPNETEFLTFGAVHLEVTDKDRSVSWWRDLIGLQPVADRGDSVQLGVDGQTLIALRANASTPIRRGYSGLYHLAINLPDEPTFAQTLARLIATRAQLSTVEHVVARSIYLSDPDGIGLELTVELPQRVKSISWPSTEQQPVIIDAQGRRRHGLEELDVDTVLAKLPPGDPPPTLPTGTRVGHIHLKVPDLQSAYAFYNERLGLIPNNYVPVIGYADLGTGDTRIHRIAVNTWTGVGLPPPPQEMAGMDHVEIRFDSRPRLDEVLGRLQDNIQHEDGYLARDPAGNGLLLSV